MCRTIYLTVPRDVDEARVNAGMRRFLSDWAVPIGTVGIGRYQNDLLLSVENPQGCQCSTWLGSVSAPDEPNQAAVDRSVAKLRGRGWSEARIRRWLDEKEKSRSKEERIFYGRVGGGTPVADPWQLLLDQLLVNEGIDHVGLLLGWNEPLPLDQEDIPLADVTPELLFSMREDTLYVFRSGVL